MNAETIAKLTGLLSFQVDLSGLHRFNASLTQVERRMKSMSRQADQLATKLGNGPKATAQKHDTSLRHNLNRELQLETAVAKAKRYTFAAELAQQKLQFAGAKQSAFLATTAVRAKQASAVADAKAHKATLERLKAQGQEIKNTATVAAAKTRQAGLEQRLAQQQVRTATLQQKHVQSLTVTQRLELALNEARERGMRAAQKFAVSQQQARLRDQRQIEAHQQKSERFEGWKARQSHWEATRNSPRGGDGFGLGSFSIALGAAGAALYALTSAVAYAGERIKLRQESASGAEQFNTALETSGGKNPLNQKFSRDKFVEISNKYGMELSVEAVKVYASFVQGQIALGKTLEQATKIYEDQSAVFRAAALDKEAQKRAAYQLGQIRAKGRPEGSDVNDLFDAVGGPVASAIRQAAATRLKFKGKVEEHAGWFKAQVTKGNILAKDFDQGMTNYLTANQDVLSKQMKSIDADQTRADNQKFMNDNQLNSSQELKDVIHERIQADRELNEAMQPVNAALAGMDIGLTKFKTALVRFITGKDADGTDNTPEERAASLASAGGADGVITLPNQGAASITEQQRLDANAADPVSNLWNWVLGGKDAKEKAEENKARWADVKVPEKSLFGFDNPSLNFEKLFKSLEVGDVADGQYRRFRPDVLEPLDVSNILGGYESQAKLKYPEPEQRPVEAPVNTTTNNITAPVTVNITTETDASAEDIARLIRREVNDSFGLTLQRTNAGLSEAK
ncbi:tape measure protein [Pseudomonas sp. Irchel s3a18]|uniref:tape measure protein n=1 Tax=Pseudomonas sp. Irchel s3a18 TaxID=2009053 RepID=UPI000BA43F1B|nr:tape measure protein [Pseudomonas sp. Irchel s3a18]